MSNQIVHAKVQDPLGLEAANALDQFEKNYLTTRKEPWHNMFKGLTKENSTYETLGKYKQTHPNFDYEWNGLDDYLRTLHHTGLQDKPSPDFSLTIKPIKIPLEVKNWQESGSRKYGLKKVGPEIIDRFPQVSPRQLRNLDRLHIPSGIVYITNKRLLNPQALMEITKRRIWIVETAKQLIEAINQIAAALTAALYCRFSGIITRYCSIISAINNIQEYYRNKGGFSGLILGTIGSVSHSIEFYRINIENKIIKILNWAKSQATLCQNVSAALINTVSSGSGCSAKSTINCRADNSDYNLSIRRERLR